jgi:uncharacterized damage-inducible protein DinB
MNCYGAKDLAASFRTVRQNTLTIAEEVGEEHYAFSPAPGVKTIGQTLTHIAFAPGLGLQIHAVEKRTTLEGFDFPGYMAMAGARMREVRNKAQIIALLQEEGEKFASWVEGLSDEFLAERITMMPGMTPESKTRFEMLLGVKEHEMHHRGQLMVAERMIGIVPHLTRAMEARMAAMAAGKATA